MRLLSFVLLLFCIVNTAYSIKPAVFVTSKGEITFDKTKQSAVVSHRLWLPNIEQRRRSIIIKLPEPKNKNWQEAKVVFKTNKDCNIGIALNPDPVKGAGKQEYIPEGVYYDNIRINGKLVKNGGFESGKSNIHFHVPDPKYPPRIIYNPELAKSGNHCMLSWFRCFPIIYTKVKANEEITLSFDYRAAGVMPESFTEYFPVSLRKVANMGFADEIARDGKGGWTDQGAINDLKGFDHSRKVYGGIPFDVINPADNNGKSCIIFKGKNTPFGLSSVTLPVDKTINTVYLLNSCAWSKKGLNVATITVNFNDSKTEEFKLVCGQNTSEWWSPKPVPEAKIVWRGGNDHGGEVGMYLTALKLKNKGLVKSINIRSTNSETALGILGVSVGMVYAKVDQFEGKNFSLNLNGKSTYTAISLDVLTMKMKEKNFPAEQFLERRENLPRLKIIGPDGKAVEFVIAEFFRRFPAVILAKTDRKTGIYKFRLQTKAVPGRILTPRAALKKLTGKNAVNYRPDAWMDGLVFYPDDLKSKAVKPEADPDSFYRTSAALNTNSVMEGEFAVSRNTTFKIYSFARADENFVNGLKVRINDKSVLLHGGFSMPRIFLWSGGQKITLPPGKYKLKIEKIWHRKKHNFCKLYMARDGFSPLIPTVNDELSALSCNHFSVYGFSPKQLKKVDRSGLLRLTAPEKSYPDFKENFRPDIDRHGVMKADGMMFRFADGTAIPSIWGCNMSLRSFHGLILNERFGGNAADKFFQRLRSLGYGMIRTMIGTISSRININNMPYPLESMNPLKLSPYFLDDLQRLVAMCHKHGIYLNLTLWNDNTFFKDLGAERHRKSFIGFFHPEAIKRQKQIVKMFMDTPNPYRSNIRPADDPTLAIYEIENERAFLWFTSSAKSWKTLPEKTRKILYGKWSEFLKDKYKDIDSLKKSWNIPTLKSVLRPGRKDETFDSVAFAPVWDVKQWGNDNSKFKIEMGDLRITKAEFGKNTTSNPIASDGLEFIYIIYRDYLKAMYDYARSLGFKGVITANAPDVELYYQQRAAADQVLDAVSGGAGYWARNGYGFIRSLAWMNPLIYTAVPDKPMISREYGSNLSGSDTSWWGGLIVAAVQKAMGKANLFNFCVGIPDIYCTDWFYPNDSLEKYIKPQNYNQEAHLYSYFSNLAAGIAARSKDLQPSNFNLEIGYPLNNVCYAAPFRGYNKLTLENFVPFTYVNSSINVFTGKYPGNADMTVNEPATPAGDYSSAKNFFAIKPHSLLDRYGKKQDTWLLRQPFSAEGFINTEQEKRKLYDTMRKAGAKLPVSRAEFCKVWRDVNRKIEIDTQKVTFRTDCSDFGAFIGILDHANGKTPHQFSLKGTGDAWSFFGNVKSQGTVFFGILNGTVHIGDMDRLRYLFAGTRNLTINAGSGPFIKISGGSTINVAFKCDFDNLATADTIYVTFFQRRSAVTPGKIEFGRNIKSIQACDPNGKLLENIPFSGKSFFNDHSNGNEIAYYRVNF